LSLYMVALGVVYPIGAVIQGKLGDEFGLRGVVVVAAAAFAGIIVLLLGTRAERRTVLEEAGRAEQQPSVPAAFAGQGVRRVAVVVCALAALFTIPAAAASSDVTMKNTMFNPSSVMVNAGDTVTWHNQDGYAHTVTANDHSFDSGNVAGTVGTYSHTFSQPGTYPYHCEIHGGMTGTVTVQG